MLGQLTVPYSVWASSLGYKIGIRPSTQSQFSPRNGPQGTTGVMATDSGKYNVGRHWLKRSGPKDAIDLQASNPSASKHLFIVLRVAIKILSEAFYVRILAVLHQSIPVAGGTILASGQGVNAQGTAKIENWMFLDHGK